MKNTQKKILIISIVVALFCLVFLNSTFAATLTLSTPKTNLSIKEEFIVDILVNVDQGENLNAFDIILTTSPNLTFSRTEDGSSIVGLWIEKPAVDNNVIHFSGIIPGGFTGLINPLISDPLQNKKPGAITRLIFYGNEAGQATLNITKKSILANNGIGTVLNINSNDLTLLIDETIFSNEIPQKDITPPEHFVISLFKDPNLFEGKYVLLFETKDKESGIDYYEVKEPNNDWKRAGSPYITSDQPPQDTIYVKAVDRAGNSIIEELISKIPISQKIIQPKTLQILIFIVFIILLFIIMMRLIKKNINDPV